MRFYSTKHQSPVASLQEAIFQGLPADNGLYMPEHIPVMPSAYFKKLPDLSLPEIAFEVTKALLGEELSDQVIEELVTDAFDFPVPLVSVTERVASLELFHGPTLAFKDFGARFMARLMSHYLKGSTEKLHILVATSGDTGSAVAQGFLGVEGIDVTILYPKGKVSHIQEQQLTTNGQNITALEIDGTFDDCQAMVKQAFLDKDLHSKLNLTSANSINISRLIPQSFYYHYGYGQAKTSSADIYFCTPSGNFGNLTGGLLAKKMGLPVAGFCAATNSNSVVPEYLRGGSYTPRASVSTISNAMDVGNPSNFPRMQDIFQNQDAAVREEIKGFYYTDEETAEAIQQVDQRYQYLMCPHSAIGYLGISDFLKDKLGQGIFLATAHPVKFKDVVEPLVKRSIAVPARLQQIIDRKKMVVEMKPRFDRFKQYLLDLA